MNCENGMNNMEKVEVGESLHLDSETNPAKKALLLKSDYSSNINNNSNVVDSSDSAVDRVAQHPYHIVTFLINIRCSIGVYIFHTIFGSFFV